MSCFKPWKKSSNNTNDIFKNVITHTLDFTRINLIICDTEFKIISSNYNLCKEKIENTNYDIKPKELLEFYTKLHKESQTKQVIIKRNILINNDLFYITVMPLYYYKILIGSSLKIIPYVK